MCSLWTFVCAVHGQLVFAPFRGWMDGYYTIRFWLYSSVPYFYKGRFCSRFAFLIASPLIFAKPCARMRALVLSEPARADEDGWGVCVSPRAWGWIHNDSEGTLPAAIFALTPPKPTSAAHIWLLGNRCSFNALCQRILSKRLGGQRRSVLCLLLLAS